MIATPTSQPANYICVCHLSAYLNPQVINLQILFFTHAIEISQI